MAGRDALYRSLRAAESLPSRRAFWPAAFGVFALATFAIHLYAARRATFFHDEWVFIANRGPWDIQAFMAPHNEHFVALAALVYKVLLSTVGLHSYLPYVALVLVLHVITAGAVFQLVRQQIGRPIALALSVLFLFLTSGAPNLMWGFQISFVGSTAAGAWALVFLLERPRHSPRRLALVALLLLVATAFSGVGLMFVAAVGAVVLFNPQRRSNWWVVVPALAAYGAWFVLFGRTAVTGHVLVLEPDVLAQYVATGIAGATGSLLGLGSTLGGLVGLLLLIWAVVRLIGKRPPSDGVVAAAVGLLAQFLISGLGRAQLGIEQAAAQRYVTIAAIFLLVLGSAWLATVLPRGRMSLRTALPLAALLGWALWSNLLQVHEFATYYTERAFETRAAIEVSVRYGGTPGLPDGRKGSPLLGNQFLDTFPSPAVLRTALAEYGTPSGIDPIPARVLRKTLFQLTSPSLLFSTAPELPAVVDPLNVVAFDDVSLESAATCVQLTPEGIDPRVSLMAAGGAKLYARADFRDEAQLFLSLDDEFTEPASRRFEMGANEVTVIVLPDLGPGTPWHVRFDPPSSGTTELCYSTQ